MYINLTRDVLIIKKRACMRIARYIMWKARKRSENREISNQF